jgi:hypothetical protein
VSNELAFVQILWFRDCRLLSYGYVNRFFCNDWRLGSSHVVAGGHAALTAETL